MEETTLLFEIATVPENENVSIDAIAALVPASKSVTDGLLYASYVTLPIFTVFGLCGNTLTLVVTQKKAYSSTFHGLVIAAMAVIDILYLICFPFHKGFIIKLLGLDLRSVTKAGCSVFVTFFRASKLCSAALVVLVSIERFALIWFPHQAKVVLNRRVAIVVISCIFVTIITFSGIFSTVAGFKNGKCVGVKITPENKRFAEAFSVMGMALHSFIPAGILLVFTPLAIIKLYFQQSMRHATADERKSKRRNELNRASLMLLSVVIAYLVLVAPFCLARNILALKGINISAAPILWARNLNELAGICEQANCVTNFFLYVWLSPSFREHFRALFSLKLSGPATSVTTNSKSAPSK